MKYEKEINQFLRDVFLEDWMNEDDYQDFLKEMEKEGFKKEDLSLDIEEGIENGYTIEQQFEIIKKTLGLKTIEKEKPELRPRTKETLSRLEQVALAIFVQNCPIKEQGIKLIEDLNVKLSYDIDRAFKIAKVFLEEAKKA